METEKHHQIYYTNGDYKQIIDSYSKEEKKQYAHEQLLIVAKAYFLDEDYESCIKILKQLNPSHSTKILFQRQSLLFRASYLLKRSQSPQAKDLAYLQSIITQFDQLKSKAPGQQFKPHHLQRMYSYRNFISFLQSYSKSITNYNQKLTLELQRADKATHKMTGFPCYLIAEQWIDDFGSMKKQLSLNTDKSYVGPLTNFAIINDIFQAHFYQSELENYKNTYIFPTFKYKVVSKKLWAFYCGIYSPEAQFFPVKRLFQQKNNREYSTISSFTTVPLVSVVVDCQNRRTIYQLVGNQIISNELLPLMQYKYGPGELKIVKNEDYYFEIFYFGEKLQKSLTNLGKILVYQKKRLPDNLRQLKIFNHLQYNPIPPTSLLNKEGGLRGLENLGNSCYLNSVVQCLSFTQKLSLHLTTTDFSQLAISKKADSDISVALSFSDLLKQLWRAGEIKYITPYKFKKYFGLKNPMFSQKTQEDAHQFLLHLLNSIHQDIKAANLKVARSLSKLEVTTNVQEVRKYFQKHYLEQNKSLITQLMRGIYHTTILCKSCQTYSHSFDLFLALSIPVPYVSYPFIRFYYVPLKSRNTFKYELTLKDVKDVNDIFTILQREVIDVKADQINEVNLGDTSSPEKHAPTKKNYILIAFTKLEDPEELWNFCSSNDLTKKQISVKQLLQCKKQLIFYEVEIALNQMQLVMVQYKYNQTYQKQRSQRVLGIPKFLLLPTETIKDAQGFLKFRKIIVQNNYEDKLYEVDIQDIKAYEWPKRSFKYNLVAYFKIMERLFLDTNFIDKQLNSSIEAYDIRDCLKQMSKPDILEGWKCGHCNHSKIAEKVEHITQTNQILIISLKRFQANGNKIKNMIQYPLQGLNMKEWLQDKNGLGKHIYDLYGVCFHSGTMSYGHYRAYCKHFITGEWYEFDDERVRKIQPADAITSQAYMLFYKRRQI